MNKETGFYNYDEVLSRPNVQKLGAVRQLLENKFASGQVVVVSRRAVPFEASDALAKIISLWIYRNDGWVRFALDAVLKSLRKTARST